MTNCGHCHTCGTPLRTVLDGEEWGATCQAYRRYPSHGWGRSACTDREIGAARHVPRLWPPRCLQCLPGRSVRTRS